MYDQQGGVVLESKSATRFFTDEPIELETYGSSTNKILPGRLKNLSQSGAYLEMSTLSYLPKKGDLIKATVNLHKLGKMRQFNAKVIWIEENKMGVAFIKKDKLIQNILEKSI